MSAPREDDALPGAIRLGRWRGIALSVHWSVLVIVALVADILAGWLPHADPGHGAVAYWGAGVLTGALFAVTVLVHELAHALVARHYRVPVRSITLWMLGGVTAFDRETPTPAADTLIAAAGPAASVAVGGIAAAVAMWLVPGTLAGAALGWLAVMSGLLAVFNLLPAAPLDGGRVLRGLLWWRLHDRSRAEGAAASAGRVLGFLMIVAGIFELLTGAVDGLWWALLGWFIVSGASAEKLAARTVRLGGVAVSRAMTRVELAAPSWWTVQQLVTPLAETRQPVVPVVDIDGRATGAVRWRDLERVPAERRATVRIGELARLRVLVVPESAQLADVAGAVRRNSVAIVVDEPGRPLGIVTAAEIDRVASLARLADLAPEPPVSRP